jgi:obg-like ATPase 1
VKGLGLLTLKPLIYAANVGEDDLGNHGANNVHVQVGSVMRCVGALSS